MAFADPSVCIWAGMASHPRTGATPAGEYSCRLTPAPGDLVPYSGEGEALCTSAGLPYAAAGTFSGDYYNINYDACGTPTGSVPSHSVSDPGLASTLSVSDATTHTDLSAMQSASGTAASVETGDTSVVADPALVTETGLVLVAAVFTAVLLTRTWDFARSVLR
jgi:hypothetical protein